MGTWEIEAFDNDDASDWIAGLHSQADLSYIESAFDHVLDIGTNYLEVSECQQAIAAAEVVARLQGNWGIRNAQTRLMDEWVVGLGLTPPPSLANKARQAVRRVKTEQSELLELWSETQDLDAWKQSLAELESRITD